MTKLIVAYIATALVFLVMDAGWLSLVGPRLYRPALGSILADKVKLAPAVIFYLMYVAGLVYFVVNPALDGAWTKAALNGALLGAFAYATYDLTCAATMRQWSTTVTVADIVWGAIASGAACAGGVLLTRAAARFTGG